MINVRGKSPIIKVVYHAVLSVISTFYVVLVLSLGFNAYLRYTHPLKFFEEVKLVSEDYGVDPLLIMSIIKVESSFNINAESEKNAIGLMQIKQETADYIKTLTGKVYDLRNAKDNVNAGTYYLKYLINKFNVEETAIVAYNAGEGNVSRWLADNRYSLDGKTLYKVPFKETENYLKKIKKSFVNYKNLYGNIVDKF